MHGASVICKPPLLHLVGCCACRLYKHQHHPGKGTLKTTQAVQCITANAHLAHSWHSWQILEQQARCALAATDRRFAQEALKHMPIFFICSGAATKLLALCLHLLCCCCCEHKLPGTLMQGLAGESSCCALGGASWRAAVEERCKGRPKRARLSRSLLCIDAATLRTLTFPESLLDPHCRTHRSGYQPYERTCRCACALSHHDTCWSAPWAP